MKLLNYKVNDFVEIYTDMEDDKFGLGKIVAIDENSIIINAVDTSGKEDGLILYNRESIYQMARDTQYCKKIQKLMGVKNTDLSQYKFMGENLLYELLDFARKNNKIVNFQLCNIHRSCSIGYIHFFDDEVCEIKQIDSHGKDDGFCSFLIENITSIKCNELEDRDLELLT